MKIEIVNKVLNNLVDEGVITPNQKLLIYLDLAHEVKREMANQEIIEASKKFIEEIAGYTRGGG